MQGLYSLLPLGLRGISGRRMAASGQDEGGERKMMELRARERIDNGKWQRGGQGGDRIVVKSFREAWLVQFSISDDASRR